MKGTNQALTVMKVNGEVLARTPGGSLVMLKPGDVLHEGDLLVTVSGSAELRDGNGQILEIPPNHSVRIGPENLAPLLHQAAHPSPFLEGPSSIPDGNPAGTTGIQGNLEQQPPSEDPLDSTREWDGHSFVRLSRIDYSRLGNPSGPDLIGRDVNDTFDFQPRATLNPRIGYFYDRPADGTGTPIPDTERPFWAEESQATNGWVNRPPTANPDTAETDEDIPVTIDLLPNDTDPDGHPLSVVSASAGHGTVSINPDGTVTYTPGEDYHGTDTLTYTISDGHGGTSTSIITVTVNPVVDAFDNTISTDEDTAVTTDVLANDTFGPKIESASGRQRR